MGRRLTAFLFDFNGTISDDEEILADVYSELFEGLGRRLTRDEYFVELAGHSEEEIICRALGYEPAGLASLVERRIGLYLTKAGDGQTVPETARAAVRLAASGGPVGVVSGAARIEIETVLAAAGLRTHLQVIVAAEDVAAGKPAPDGYLRALEALGIDDPASAVAFEDSEAGVLAAKAAGLTCVAVLGTLPPERLSRADRLVPRLDEEAIRGCLARHPRIDERLSSRRA